MSPPRAPEASSPEKIANVSYSHSGREVLLAWLQWNDPNGCYMDDLAAAEGFAPMSIADAWTHVAGTLEDA